MANIGNRNTTEGYSITRPPLFDNLPFEFWKTRMLTFLQSTDYRMWMLIQEGYSPPSHEINGVKTEISFTEWTFDERDLAQLNAKRLNCFFCALKSEDYMRVSTCKTGKEIWDKLCITYEDLNTYSIDNLLGSLIAYEKGVNQRNLDAGEKKKEKTIALKAHKSDSESFGSKSDEIAFITRQFKSFLRKKQKHHQSWRKGKDHKHVKGSSDVVCFECRKPGHVRADCPTLQDHSSKDKEKCEEKAKSRKGKKKIQKGFWAESDTDSSETELEEETTNLCFMGEDQSDEEASGSSSRVTLDPRFREAKDQAAYRRYKECGITLSRTINPAHLSYSISTIGDKLHLISSDPDFDWSTANHFLRQTNAPFHVGETSSLVKDARIIQHVLRTSIIPKAGDRIHITPLLSLTTFYIMAQREFNSTDLLFRYIDHLTTIRDPGHKRKLNLALGHIKVYVLETKYNLQYPARPDLHPPYYSNNSFTAFHSTRLLPGDGEGRGAREEEAPTPAPVLDPVPLHQHSPVDQLIERFDRWEIRFDAYVAAQEQQHSEDIARYEQNHAEDLAHFDSYMVYQQQQHDQDIAWFNA
ncbi:hypothetical protein KFK09_017551 [Dendrobium nobile]|uniref:CCHC-type domain-containing protein n=1 Tax=Dendrobium nobile TaxID=94219 RepID=A0A8T3B2J5_DENNO|nr:hypothetical protein KFK09_017551 [Dendrobium nobile]